MERKPSRVASAMSLAVRRRADETSDSNIVRLDGEAVLDRLVRARRHGRVHAAGKPIMQNLLQIVDAATSADRPLAFDGGARNISLQSVVVDELAAGLREQMNAGRKAAGHQHQIARDGLG